MNESKNIALNTVSSKDQLEVNSYVKIINRENSAFKVLFVGNSITRHAPKADIGWNGDWGMAASCEANDYVHRTVSMLEEKYGAVSYCVAQLATWERDYIHTADVMAEHYTAVRDFAADLVVIRIGENINREEHEKVSCKPYYDEMIRYFAANPHAKVIVTDNFWKRESLDKAFREVAEERGYIFCHIGDLEDDKRTMALGLFEHRGVSIHPGDYGMEMIAKRIFEAVPEMK